MSPTTSRRPFKAQRKRALLEQEASSGKGGGALQHMSSRYLAAKDHSSGSSGDSGNDMLRTSSVPAGPSSPSAPPKGTETLQHP